MGQAEILKVLKEDKWMHTVEVAKELNQHHTTVSVSLRKLFKQCLVHKKEGRCKKEGNWWRLR